MTVSETTESFIVQDKELRRMNVLPEDCHPEERGVYSYTILICNGTSYRRLLRRRDKLKLEAFIQTQGYFNFLNASPSLEIISLISSFLQVPTLSLYQAESRLAPKA